MTEYISTNHNLEDVTLLLSKFIDESVFEGEILLENVKEMLKNDRFLTIVAYDDKPIGLFMAHTYDHPIFKNSCSDDIVLYVDGSHRGGLTAIRFIKKYITWAESKSVKYIQLGQSAGVGDINRVGKFFESMGFKTVGFNTLRGI
jgi:hypothetical protein